MTSTDLLGTLNIYGLAQNSSYRIYSSVASASLSAALTPILSSAGNISNQIGSVIGSIFEGTAESGGIISQQPGINI